MKKIYTLIAAAAVGLGCILVCADCLGTAGIAPADLLGIENPQTWAADWLDFWDMLSEGVMMPLGALLMSLMIGWEIGPEVVKEEAEQQGNGLPVHRLRDGDAAEGWIQAVVHFRFAQPNAEHLGILWDTDAAASQGIQATLGHAVILVVDDTGALAENAVFLGGGGPARNGGRGLEGPFRLDADAQLPAGIEESLGALAGAIIMVAAPDDRAFPVTLLVDEGGGLRAGLGVVDPGSGILPAFGIEEDKRDGNIRIFQLNEILLAGPADDDAIVAALQDGGEHLSQAAAEIGLDEQLVRLGRFLLLLEDTVEIIQSIAQ